MRLYTRACRPRVVIARISTASAFWPVRLSPMCGLASCRPARPGALDTRQNTATGPDAVRVPTVPGLPANIGAVVLNVVTVRNGRIQLYNPGRRLAWRCSCLSDIRSRSPAATTCSTRAHRER